MIYRLLMAITFLMAPAFGQEKPNDSDSKVYKQAYELLFDSQARAKKAVALLLDDGKKELAALSEKELSLLCRAYNELAQFEKQLEVSKEIWTRFPDSPEATRWMVNSLEITIRDDEDAAKATAFVDSAIADKKGLRSELLVLKARTLLHWKKKNSDAERSVLVSDILIDAFACHKSDNQFDPPYFEDVNFVDMDPSFSRYFSAVERETLKVRMRKARDSNK